MSTSPPDYRASHLSEGEDYHRKFSEHPYRAVIWEIEQRILLEALSRFVPNMGEARLLDFACGTGRVLAFLEHRFGAATGIDVSSSMLMVAKQQLHSSDLHCTDITRTTEFDDRRYEAITAFRFFPNAEPDLRSAVMAKLSLMLSRDGVVIFNNHLRCGSLRHRIRRLLFAFGIKKNVKDLHCMSDEEAAMLASQHGLALTARYHLGVIPVLKERRPLLPVPIIRAVERWAAKVRLLAPVSGHMIYVFRRNQDFC